VAVSAGVNPASLLNGSTEVTTTGTTAAQIAADLAGLLAAVTTPGPLVWIMQPKTMYRIALVLGSQAAGLPNRGVTHILASIARGDPMVALRCE
jgi:hypothetical protein